MLASADILMERKKASYEANEEFDESIVIKEGLGREERAYGRG